MKKIRTLSTAALLTLTLAGCASLDRDQCLHADWRQIGFADGTKGWSGARIDDHAKACAEYGVRPQLNEYLAGRRQGLNSYCQAENGFELGRHGSPHNAADCVEDLKPAFLEQYHRGSQIHAIENELAERRNRIDANERETRRGDERIAAIKTALRGDLPGDRRAALLDEFNRLLGQKETLVRDSQLLQPEIDRLQHRLFLKLREFGH